MRRVLAALTAVALLASVGTGLLVWRLSRDPAPPPQISAYTHGQLTRVGPYRYCDVLNLDDCRNPRQQGELTVNARDPVQLSVSERIAAAPWRLLRVYQNPADTTVSVFRPDARLAVTIPTVDPQRGRLSGVVVQLMTLVRTPDGQVTDMPHAEWSVRTVWS